MILRELTGGIYFGKPKEIIKTDSGLVGIDTMVYNENEIRRIIRAGFELASNRKGILTSVDKANMLEIDSKFLSRSLNEGFSGGEKKRNEIFQMAMLEPSLAILDETDSGLDIDALRIVANGVNKIKSSSNAIVIITHYQRLLDHIIPDYVHVLQDGKIAKSGNKELALQLEEKGYDWI